MPTTQIALIADDLTGALDSAAPFALAGCRTLVATGPEHLIAALALHPEVVAVSLGSRELGAEVAAERAGQAARILSQHATRLFKKIDSRMKGHVGAEVEAIVAACGLSSVCVCPAIPELGRIVRRGALQGAGVILPIPVADAFALAPNIELTCPDAETAEDLERIVAEAGNSLLVGARGLAAALAGKIAGKGRMAENVLGLPIAFVVGSRDPITLSQVARLREAAAPLWIACPDGEVPTSPLTGSAIILQATPGHGADGATVAALLAQGATSGLAGRRTLLLTGGETAAATLAAMGVGILDLLGEIETGMPVSRPLDLPAAPIVVTKSGGFGDEDCLLRLLTLASTSEK